MKRINSGLKKNEVFSLNTKKTTLLGKLDLPLLGAVVLLSILGLILVFDSSPIEAYHDAGNQYYFIKYQIYWMMLGFVSLIIFSFIDYHRLEKLALPLLFFSLFLLFLVFIPGLGISAGGAHRWLKVAFITIQPAEIIKLATIIFLSTLFKNGIRIKPFIALVTAVFFIVGILQKDLGTAIVYSLISVGIFFVGGAPAKYLLASLLVGLTAIVGFIAVAPYRIKRVMAFIDPFADTQGYTYHISQVLIALGSGGLFGLGVGQSRQKYAFIPEVTTDSIFSVVGEEFGFIGGLLLISLLLFLIFRGLKIAENATDNFGKLMASGLVIWIGGQALINLAAMVALIPLTGVPLPFVSYGGSSLLANLTAIGILLNISKQSKDINAYNR